MEDLHDGEIYWDGARMFGADVFVKNLYFEES